MIPKLNDWIVYSEAENQNIYRKQNNEYSFIIQIVDTKTLNPYIGFYYNSKFCSDISYYDKMWKLYTRQIKVSDNVIGLQKDIDKFLTVIENIKAFI